MTSFEEGLERFLATVDLDLPQGVPVELDHFLPDGWSYTVQDGVPHVAGPGDADWSGAVRRLVGVLAYACGSVVRRTSPDRWELYTWLDDEGTGFKVVFVKNPA